MGLLIRASFGVLGVAGILAAFGGVMDEGGLLSLLETPMGVGRLVFGK